MAYSGIITAPISIYDVQQALGVSLTDVGRLCSSPAINKWARYKPVPKAGVAIQQVWLHPIGSGFELSIATDTPVNIIQNDGYGLVCDLPSGTLASPYRLTDFNYYSPSAVRPIAFACDATIEEGTVPGFTIGIDSQINGFSGDYNIRLKDIIDTDTFGSYRLTAAIVSFVTQGDWATATPIRFFYSEETWDSNTGNELVVFCYGWSRMNLQEGVTYGVVMMLTDSEYERTGTATCYEDAMHLQLENACERATFTVRSEGSGVISANDFNVWSGDYYYDDTTELPDSPGVYYNTHQAFFDQIRITRHNGFTYSGDPFAGYKMRLAISIYNSLAINSDGTADTESSFDERRFYLTEWFTLAIGTGTWANVSIDSQTQRTVIVDINQHLQDYFYQEHDSTPKDITVEIWMKRDLGSGNSFIAGGVTAQIKNNEEFGVRDGVLTVRNQ